MNRRGRTVWRRMAIAAALIVLVAAIRQFSWFLRFASHEIRYTRLSVVESALYFYRTTHGDLPEDTAGESWRSVLARDFHVKGSESAEPADPYLANEAGECLVFAIRITPEAGLWDDVARQNSFQLVELKDSAVPWPQPGDVVVRDDGVYLESGGRIGQLQRITISGRYVRTFTGTCELVPPNLTIPQLRQFLRRD